MKALFERRINKFLMLAFLVVLIMGITGCRQGDWPTTPYTTWKEEFTGFDNFWSAFIGWPIAVLSYPAAYLCYNIGHGLGNSFAWGIFFTTLIVRTAAWPIYSKQSNYTLQMQLMQPEQQRIAKKYAGRTDPESKQRMNMETMSLYKKYKISPVGCIFTMFMQFPIFMAMYEVVRRINITTSTVVTNGVATVVESTRFSLINTKIFGFFELNTSFFEATELKDKIFAVVISLMYGGITIISQKLLAKKPSYMKKTHETSSSAQTKPNDQAKQMQSVTTIMTVMFVFFCLQSTSLAFYWFIGALYQILQSYIGRIINEKKFEKMKENTII